MNDAKSGDHKRIIVLFTLAGASLGVVLAMFICATPDWGYGQTDIHESVSLTIGTTTVGLMVGVLLSNIPVRTGLAMNIGVMLLTGLLGASMGWLVGDGEARDHEKLRIPPSRATAEGGLVGLFIGVLVLAPRWLKRTGKR
jgi:hypothetical protein